MSTTITRQPRGGKPVKSEEQKKNDETKELVNKITGRLSKIDEKKPVTEFDFYNLLTGKMVNIKTSKDRDIMNFYEFKHQSAGIRICGKKSDSETKEKFERIIEYLNICEEDVKVTFDEEKYKYEKVERAKKSAGENLLHDLSELLKEIKENDEMKEEFNKIFSELFALNNTKMEEQIQNPKVTNTVTSVSNAIKSSIEVPVEVVITKEKFQLYENVTMDKENPVLSDFTDVGLTEEETDEITEKYQDYKVKFTEVPKTRMMRQKRQEE